MTQILVVVDKLVFYLQFLLLQYLNVLLLPIFVLVDFDF